MAQIPVDTERQKLLLSHCRDAIARGEIELGERVCRDMNASGWGDGRTWMLISEVARIVGRRDVALDAAARAAAATGLHAGEVERIRTACEAMVESSPGRGGLHVIRSWGQGFWSDVDHVVGQLVVAEMTGRTPIVLWGANSRFGDGTKNAWESFFEPVSAGTIPCDASFFPRKWRADNLTVAENGAFSGPGSRIAFLPFLSSDAAVTVSDFHAPLLAISHWIPASSPLFARPVREIYQSVLGDRVRIRADIAARVDEAANRLGVGGGQPPVIAVHVRGSDKVIEMGDMRPVHEAFHAEIARQIDALGPHTRVLLLTDWEPAAQEYRAKYGTRLIETAAVRTAGDVGLHFQKDRDGRRLGEDVLIDTMLASRCDAFVGIGWSNVSLYMSYFARIRGMEDDRIALIGPNMHENYNWFLLRRG
ncbi:MAG: O-fucosyltransferase family protein [Phycisphaeraceae bacterium]|nr:O-fucosyltransferase family protein [Phycisphaeraceae bacterium]